MASIIKVNKKADYLVTKWLDLGDENISEHENIIENQNHTQNQNAIVQPLKKKRLVVDNENNYGFNKLGLGAQEDRWDSQAGSKLALDLKKSRKIKEVGTRKRTRDSDEDEDENENESKLGMIKNMKKKNNEKENRNS